MGNWARRNGSNAGAGHHFGGLLIYRIPALLDLESPCFFGPRGGPGVGCVVVGSEE